MLLGSICATNARRAKNSLSLMWRRILCSPSSTGCSSCLAATSPADFFASALQRVEGRLPASSGHRPSEASWRQFRPKHHCLNLPALLLTFNGTVHAKAPAKVRADYSKSPCPQTNFQAVPNVAGIDKRGALTKSNTTSPRSLQPISASMNGGVVFCTGCCIIAAALNREP